MKVEFASLRTDADLDAWLRASGFNVLARFRDTPEMPKTPGGLDRRVILSPWSDLDVGVEARFTFDIASQEANGHAAISSLRYGRVQSKLARLQFSTRDLAKVFNGVADELQVTARKLKRCVKCNTPVAARAWRIWTGPSPVSGSAAPWKGHQARPVCAANCQKQEEGYYSEPANVALTPAVAPARHIYAQEVWPLHKDNTQVLATRPVIREWYAECRVASGIAGAQFNSLVSGLCGSSTSPPDMLIAATRLSDPATVANALTDRLLDAAYLD